MQTRRLGSLEVSVVGIGCNNFGRRIDDRATDEVVSAAVDAGITLFDTADIYGGDGASERLLGRALGRRRDQVLIATKFGGELDEERRGAHPDHVRAACDASLQRLGTDHIDLYQLHFPDRAVPISETLGALHELVVAGKVREIGHSNLDAAQIDEAAAEASRTGVTPFVCAQHEWSLLQRDVEVDQLGAIRRHGLAVLPYFPLASGLLTGKYGSGTTPDPGWRISRYPDERRAAALAPERITIVDALAAFAAERGHSLLELAFAWLTAQPEVVSVIAGATSAEQVRTNAGATAWELTPDDLASLDSITAATGG